MPDINNIESRLSKIEEKIKFNLFEIERRLIDLEAAKPAMLEDRVQHVEDLLMLIQIENEKIKQMLAARFPAPAGAHVAADIEERLARLEERLPEGSLDQTPLSKQIEELDKCLSDAMENFNKRLISLEEHSSANKNENELNDKSASKAGKKGVLEDVHSILHA